MNAPPRPSPQAADEPSRETLLAALVERDRELAEARGREEATAEVLEVINASGADLEAAFDAIVEKAMRLCGAAFGGLWVVDGDIARAGSVRNFPKPYRDFLTREPVPLALLFGRAARDRSILQIEDLAATEAYRSGIPVTVASVELGGVRSCLGVPLREAGSVIGILNLMRQDIRPFSDGEIAIAQGFARQAQIAMKNARLINETQQAMERQTATADILKVIAKSPSDVQPVFDAIAASANRLIGGHSTAVFRFIGGAIHLAAFTPTTPEVDEASKALFPGPVAEFPPLALVRDGGATQVVDTESESYPSWYSDLARLRGFRSLLFTPLMNDDVPIGMISLTRKQPGAFAPHDVELLRTFADQAVIAISNVGLFNETQEALERETATAEVLKVISRSAFDLQTVLDTLVRSAVTLCEAGGGILYVKSGEAFYGKAFANYGEESIRYFSTTPQYPGRQTV